MCGAPGGGLQLLGGAVHGGAAAAAAAAGGRPSAAGRRCTVDRRCCRDEAFNTQTVSHPRPVGLRLETSPHTVSGSREEQPGPTPP